MKIFLFYCFKAPPSDKLNAANGPHIYLLGKVNPVAVVTVLQAKYSFENPLDGIDCCFKAFWALNCPYPANSAHVWQFLQKKVYSMCFYCLKMYA